MDFAAFFHRDVTGTPPGISHMDVALPKHAKSLEKFFRLRRAFLHYFIKNCWLLVDSPTFFKLLVRCGFLTKQL